MRKIPLVCQCVLMRINVEIAGKYIFNVFMVIDVQQWQLNSERMKDANAAITLLENDLKNSDFERDSELSFGFDTSVVRASVAALISHMALTAQLLEHCTGHAKVVQSLIFFRLFFHWCYGCILTFHSLTNVST